MHGFSASTVWEITVTTLLPIGEVGWYSALIPRAVTCRLGVLVPNAEKQYKGPSGPFVLHGLGLGRRRFSPLFSSIATMVCCTAATNTGVTSRKVQEGPYP